MRLVDRYALLSALALLVLTGTTAGAEAPTGTLSWADCVTCATAHHPALAATRAQIDAAAADTQVARAAMRPQLSAGASADRSSRAGINDGADPSYGVSASFAQSLYSGGRNTANLRSTRAAYDRTEASAAATLASVTYDLRTAFVSVLYGQERIDVLRRIERRLQDNKELVELRYEGGREHKGSLAMSRAACHAAAVDSRQAERELGVAQQTLLRTMGVPGTACVVRAAFVTDVVPREANWLEAARETPGYAAAAAARAVAEAELAAARSGYFPDLSLGASASRSGDSMALDNDQWSAGLRVSFPFWSGGRTRADVSRARASVREAEANLAGAVHGRARDLADAWLAFTNAAENVTVRAAYLSAAETRAEIARQQYGDGLLSFDNWDLIESDLIARRRSLLESQRAAMQAEAAWWRTTGRSAFGPVRNVVGDLR